MEVMTTAAFWWYLFLDLGYAVAVGAGVGLLMAATMLVLLPVAERLYDWWEARPW